MQRSGTANLPLHPGKCPPWLFEKMTRLSGLITEFIIEEHGTGEFLARVSDPFFFQALGCVIGFDFHSSGLTTTTCGALKEYLNKHETGIRVAGGKGKASRKTPQEIAESDLPSKKIEELQYASRIAAKIDNSVVQDGYELYHHSFFFDEEKGNYAIVQQGMNSARLHSPDMFGCSGGYARRYHWLSDKIGEFVEEPHTAICGEREKYVLNLTAKQSRETRNASVDMVLDNPLHIYKYFGGQTTLASFTDEKVLSMKADHWIRSIDLTEKDKEILNRAYELQPKDYEELLMVKGMGPKKIRALALVAELIYGTEISWRDPVKFAYAHGGKDGIPFPVQRADYENTIEVLENALHSGGMEKQKRIEAVNRVRRFFFTGKSEGEVAVESENQDSA